MLSLIIEVLVLLHGLTTGFEITIVPWQTRRRKPWQISVRTLELNTYSPSLSMKPMFVRVHINIMFVSSHMHVVIAPGRAQVELRATTDGAVL